MSTPRPRDYYRLCQVIGELAMLCRMKPHDTIVEEFLTNNWNITPHLTQIGMCLDKHITEVRERIGSRIFRTFRETHEEYSSDQHHDVLCMLSGHVCRRKLTLKRILDESHASRDKHIRSIRSVLSAEGVASIPEDILELIPLPDSNREIEHIMRIKVPGPSRDLFKFVRAIPVGSPVELLFDSEKFAEQFPDRLLN